MLLLGHVRSGLVSLDPEYKSTDAWTNRYNAPRGFDAQINGAVISVASFRRDYGYVLDGEAILPADWQTAFNVISTVGQFFGGFMTSWIGDRIGRKWTLALGIIICTGGAVGEIASNHRVAFLFSKLVLGVGLGFYLTLAPLMCSEIAPVALRGFATAGVNLGIAIGQLLSNAVVKGFGEREDSWAYRGPFATQLFFVILGVAYMVMIGSAGGLIGSFIFLDKEKPKYPTGFGTSLALAGAGAVSCIVLELTYWRINKEREKISEDEIRDKYSPEQLEELDDRSPLFRYSL